MQKNIPQDKAHDAVKKYYKSKYSKSLKPQRSLKDKNSFRSYKRKMNRKGVPRSFFLKTSKRKSKSRAKKGKSGKRKSKATFKKSSKRKSKGKGKK